MGHNATLTPKKHAFPRLFGQIPLTRVRDYSYAVKVELVKHDDPDTMINGTFDFVKATWSDDGRESERASDSEKQDALRQMLSGKTLQLGLETVGFIFRISGISRIDTHQIVRQRIGVTFSQQCSGDQFWNHHDCLVEPSIYYQNATLGDYTTYHQFVRAMLEAKRCYQEMLDTGISVQAARSILPHCLETFIFMRIDLATLLLFHRKRIDNGSQTWQMNSIAQQMADAVSKVFPELKETFENNKRTYKFQVEASKDRGNTFSTGLYLPDPDEFEYHERDFLYPYTKNQMHKRAEYQEPEFPMKHYWGNKLVTEERYGMIKEVYSSYSSEAENKHYTTELIFKDIAEINREIRRVVDE